MSDASTTLTFSLPRAFAQRIRDRAALTGGSMSGEIAAACREYYRQMDVAYADWHNRPLDRQEKDFLIGFGEIPFESIVNTMRLVNLRPGLADRIEQSTQVELQALRAVLRAYKLEKENA